MQLIVISLSSNQTDGWNYIINSLTEFEDNMRFVRPKDWTDALGLYSWRYLSLV